VTVQGNAVNVATGDAALSAIDSGTTLIGGPTDDVQTIWAAIPGSSLVGPTMPGFYQFRTWLLLSFFTVLCLLIACIACSTTVKVSMSFGGKVWPINPEDMNLGPGNGGTMCLGGIFDLTLGSNIQANSGNPTWVVGDTFMVRIYLSSSQSLGDVNGRLVQKNVYTVFKQKPLSIGFAQLSDLAGGSGTLRSLSLPLFKVG
jgi:cathepsin D